METIENGLFCKGAYKGGQQGQTEEMGGMLKLIPPILKKEDRIERR